MLKWCFKRYQKNFTILIGIFRLLTWAWPLLGGGGGGGGGGKAAISAPAIQWSEQHN
jgi:hypothetical protein